MKADVLRAAGIDYEAGVARFLGDEALYETVLTAFMNDDVVRLARDAYMRGDRAALLSKVHEAKGASGNADLTDVYEAACALVTLLRGGAYTDAELEAGYLRFEAAYLRAQKGIREAQEG